MSTRAFEIEHSEFGGSSEKPCCENLWEESRLSLLTGQKSIETVSNSVLRSPDTILALGPVEIVGSPGDDIHQDATTTKSTQLEKSTTPASNLISVNDLPPELRQIYHELISNLNFKAFDILAGVGDQFAKATGIERFNGIDRDRFEAFKTIRYLKLPPHASQESVLRAFNQWVANRLNLPTSDNLSASLVERLYFQRLGLQPLASKEEQIRALEKLHAGKERAAGEKVLNAEPNGLQQQINVAPVQVDRAENVAKPLAPAEVPATAAQQRIDSLIKQLGDDSYRTREAAHARLRELGIKALPQLVNAANHADLEIKLQSKRLVRELIQDEILNRQLDVDYKSIFTRVADIQRQLVGDDASDDEQLAGELKQMCDELDQFTANPINTEKRIANLQELINVEGLIGRDVLSDRNRQSLSDELYDLRYARSLSAFVNFELAEFLSAFRYFDLNAMGVFRLDDNRLLGGRYFMMQALEREPAYAQNEEFVIAARRLGCAEDPEFIKLFKTGGGNLKRLERTAEEKYLFEKSRD